MTDKPYMNYVLHAKSRGVPFIVEPHLVAEMGQTETWMTFFKDTEENTHAFVSEVQGETV